MSRPMTSSARRPFCPVALQPGMSISVTGSLSQSAPALGDPIDVLGLTINTVAVTSITFSMVWPTPVATMSMTVYDSGSNPLGAASINNGTSLALIWGVTIPTAYIVPQQTDTVTAAGTYTLIITAN